MGFDKAAERLTHVLEQLRLPVGRIFYKGESDTYLTYRLIQAVPCEYSDDDYERLLFTFAVIINTKDNPTALLTEAIELLRSKGYTISAIESESLDIDTEFYYVPIIIKILEE